MSHESLPRLLPSLTLLCMLLSPGAWAESVLDRAVMLMDEGKVQDAELVMKQGLQESPDDVELRYLLGKLYLDNYYAEGAEKELSRARQGGMPEELVLYPLGRAYLLQQKFREVLSDFPDSLELHPELRAQVLTLRALADLGLEDRQSARDALRAALLLDPNNRDAQIANARVLIASAEIAPARTLLDKLVEQYPECIECWQLLGEAAQKARDSKQADTAFSRALQLEPDNFLATIGRASLALGRGDLITAGVLIDAARSKRPDDPLVAFLGASLAFQSGDLAKAQELIPAARNGLPNHVPSTILDGLIAQAAKRPDYARDQLRRALSTEPGNALAIKALAQLELTEERFAEVVNLLEPVVDRGIGGSDIRGLLATAQMQMGNIARADELMAGVAAEDPGMRIQMSAGRIAEGDVETGMAGLREAAALDPEATRPQFLLTVGLLQQEKFTEALDQANALRTRGPDNPAYHNLVGAAQIGLNDLDAAAAAFTQAVALNNGFLPARHNLARVALLRGDVALARTHLDEILTLDEGNADALLQLARLDAAAGHVDAAMDQLRKLLARHPGHLIAGRTLAENLLRRNRANEAADVARGLLQAQPDEPEAERILARAYAASDDVSNAVMLLKRLVARFPESAEDQALLGSLMLAGDDRAGAITALRRAYELNPRDENSGMRLASLLMDGKQFDEARVLVDRMMHRHPLAASPHELRGDLFAQQGESQRALIEYQLAQRNGESSRILTKLYLLRLEQAGTEEALQPLQNWLQTHPEDNAMRLFLAGELERMGDDGVKAMYEAVLKYDPANVMALNNLAMRSLDKDPAAALAYAELGYQAAPEDPFVLDTYAQALVRMKRPLEAIPLLEKAIDLLKTEPELRFNLARAYVAANQPGNARDQLRRIMITYADFKDMEAVQVMLQQLRGR